MVAHGVHRRGKMWPFFGLVAKYFDSCTDNRKQKIADFQRSTCNSNQIALGQIYSVDRREVRQVSTSFQMTTQRTSMLWRGGVPSDAVHGSIKAE